MISLSRLYGIAVTLMVVAGTSIALPGQVKTAVPTREQMQQEIQTISAELTVTQKQLQDSQRRVDELQKQLAAIQAQLAPDQDQTQTAATAPAPDSQKNAENIEILQAEVKLHDQTKVESASKYPVQVTGLILFNSFLVKGGVDNLDLPTLATAVTPGSSNVATGASVRQTILGVQASGPVLFGAKSSGEVNFDFYGGIPYSNYNTVSGIVRLRTAALRLDWEKNNVELGFVQPLISPLEPTSYAMVAEPALAWAGNLWTWAPQFSYQHSFGVAQQPHMTFQAGLWDPPTAGYNADQLFRSASSSERSGQPAYESRIAFTDPRRGTNGMQVGLGGYYSRQSYTGRAGDSWAVTADWRLPVSRFFELSGEAYRGRALGGLGGGVYKDIESGTDPVTGSPTFRLLNAGGGWLQTKFRFTRVLEANTAAGLDDGFSRDFHAVVIPAGASGTQLRARNRMIMTNMIYSPKTYLIFSPEYRRISTWPIYGSATNANIFTLSFGLRF
ncbi:MAG TPA: hypothetical protein VL346_07670 [Acidobacteriaceae bacterium]|jgi:hypothetical protein|nr:hypothetical protein [Acidobacteriaceae bacterium]